MDTAFWYFLITVIGCFVALAGWLASRDKKLSSDSEWKGTINAKLDVLLTSTQDMGRSHETLKCQVSAQGELLAAVKQNQENLDHRVTRMEKML